MQFNMGAEEKTAEIEVEAGKAYDLEVRFSNFKQLHSTSPYVRGSSAHFSIPVADVSDWSPWRYPHRRSTETQPCSGDREGGQASPGVGWCVQHLDGFGCEAWLMRLVVVTVLTIGTNSEWESEGYDRSDIKLPRNTDDLVRAVLGVNPNTIIVNQSGMPVELPWISQATTLVQAFFGGNECGTAIADAIFGRINPSGKLPVTWPVRLEDFPSHEGFGDNKTTVYTEGLGVGYRHFDRPGKVKSAFPFGYGLSYTTFAYR
jgi:beta-glucosidase